MTQGKQLTIHGHFYQPPREDPWLDAVLPEGSAAPARHWNERICAESYAPLAFARRLDGDGRVVEIMNCYEYISFNFGPTLFGWLEGHAPEVYARVLEGDAKSLARLGHGNAIAQIHHHVIMPLATDLDKRAEIAWALADFTARFKRPAEGLWLSEAAVDTRTLDLLARAGIKFTILAPRQAAQTASLDRDDWADARESDLDIRRPYLAELPGGRSIAIFFYNGPLSQAVAFEGLLRHGDFLWGRLASEAGDGLLTLATDGETYGHHVKFGEMALAFALSQARAGVAGARLTNYATYLAENPPLRRVRIRENSSWSCVHGVERWRADCGCNAEHRPGWNQRWRAPLRDGLNAVKARMDEHFESVGARVFVAPEAALTDYGRVLAGLDSEAQFAATHFASGLTPEERHTAWRLLTMEKWALSSFASCAWFFDDIGRIEPLNALTFCLRAMQIGRRTGLPDLAPLLLSFIEKARSNEPRLGGGRDLWNREVAPRCETSATLVLQAFLRLRAEGRLPPAGRSATAVWPGLSVTLAVSADDADGGLRGRAEIAWRRETARDACAWLWEPVPGVPVPGVPVPGVPVPGVSVPDVPVPDVPVPDVPDADVPDADEVPTAGRLRTGATFEAAAKDPGVTAADLPWSKRQALVVAWIRRVETESWRSSVAAAQPGARFFSPYREAQTAPIAAEAWNALWPALAWVWIERGGAAADDFLDFLRARARAHPEAELLARRLGEALARMLAADPPECAAAADILRRAGRVGLAPDLRTAQNVWWMRRKGDPACREIGRLLGFAPQGLP